MRVNPIHLGFGIGLSLLFAFMTSSTALAEPSYTCNYSGNNGGNQYATEEGTFTGTITYRDGNCVMQKPTGENIAPLNGACVEDGYKLHSDGRCWQYTEELTNAVPTYVDGSQVPTDVWQNMCSQNRHAGGGPDGTSSYDADNHRCSGIDNGIFSYEGCYGDITSQYNHSTRGYCTTIDDPTAGLSLEEDYAAPDKQRAVTDCIDGGGVFDAKKPDGQKCSYTAESCTAKGLAFDRAAGTCVQPPAYCDKYTDQAQKEACEKGQAGEDCNQFTDPAQKEACEDGANNNPNTAGGPTKPPIDKVETRCGEARVNILICGEEGGNTALNNILRIVVMVLTVGVGAAAVGGLAWASILYAKAEDNEGNVSSAKELIRNVVIGLLLYVFLIAITNWLVPGGVVG